MLRGTALTLVLTFVVPSVAHAQPQLVGFTSTSVGGHSGMLTMTAACQAEFGPNTRICLSEEVMRTTLVPSLPSGFAWVMPSFQAFQDASSTSRQALDASGVQSDPFFEMTCEGWGGADVLGLSSRGLTVKASGGFSLRECTTSRPVACCTVPSPIPVASTSAPWGRLALVTALLVSGAVFAFRPAGRGPRLLRG